MVQFLQMIISMKRFLSISLTVLFTVIALCFQAPAWAQDDDFPELTDHEVALQQVVKEWHSKGLYTAGWAEKPTIRNYFVGLANAYPGDLFQMMVGKMLGLGTDDALSEYTLDERNGYISGELGTETSPSVQMCFWNCKDGSRLVGVALQGYEYNLEEADPDWTDEEIDDNIFVNLNDIAFFRILSDEMIWRPVAVRDICGREIDFREYDRIEMPRQGKDIRLIFVPEIGEEDVVTTLAWDGTRFTVKLPAK